jgi:hypothetical protein
MTRTFATSPGIALRRMRPSKCSITHQCSLAHKSTVERIVSSVFAGRNVAGWDGRPLPYYSGGIDASARLTLQLLQSQGNEGQSVPTTSGQCGSFVNLLLDALDVNGILAAFKTVTAIDGSGLVTILFT